MDELNQKQNDFLKAINSCKSDIDKFYCRDARPSPEISSLIRNFNDKILPFFNNLLSILQQSEVDNSRFKSLGENSRQCCEIYRDSFFALIANTLRLEERNRKLESSILQISHMFNCNIKELEREKQRIQPLEKENKKLQIKIQIYQQNEEMLKKYLLQKFEIPFKMEMIESGITNLNEILKKRDENKSELNELQAKIISTNEYNEQLILENNLLKEELEQKQQEYEKLEEQKEKYLKQSEESQNTISSLKSNSEKEIAELKDKIQMLEKSNERLNSHLAVLREDKSKFDEKLQEAQETFDQKLNEINVQLEEANKKRNQFKDASTHWNKLYKETKAQSDNYQKELNEALEKISDLEKEKEELEKEIELMTQLNEIKSDDENKPLPPSSLPELKEPQISESREISDDAKDGNDENEQPNEAVEQNEIEENENEEEKDQEKNEEEPNEEGKDQEQNDEEINGEQNVDEDEERDDHSDQNEEVKQHEEEDNNQAGEHEENGEHGNQDDEGGE